MFGKKNDVAIISKLSETDSFEQYAPGYKKDLTSKERRLPLKFMMKIIEKKDDEHNNKKIKQYIVIDGSKQQPG